MASLRLGDQLSTIDGAVEDGLSWRLVHRRTPTPRTVYPSGLRGDCWVAAPLTVEFSPSDPEPALTRVADHVLGRDDATFEDLVAAENLFAWEPFARVTASSGRLQLRRFQLINQAAIKFSAQTTDQLTQAWIISHRDVLAQSAFSRSWYVQPEVFWRLLAAHEDAPEADEIAWSATQAHIPSDECFARCILDLLTRTYKRYWTRFPDGREVVGAITRAALRVDRAARYCIVAPFVGRGPLADGSPGGVQELVGELRLSLEHVTVVEKDQLLVHLSEVEQVCGGDVVSDVQDPRAIPRLARSLGLGFSSVRRTLAGLGEQAAPAVLDVLTSERSGPGEINDALMTLRFMVETAYAGSLSDASLERIRQATEQRLAGVQRLTTLWRAIDLAIVLEDPRLRQIVESLASDPDEVIARGVEEPDLIERTQQRAADRLAGVPARPRP